LVSQADDNSTSIQCSVVVPEVLNAEASNSDYSHQTMTSKQDFSVYITATKLSDQEKLDALEKRWKPQKPDDYPSSMHTNSGVQRRRSLNSGHMQRYPWIAVS